jgi:hypothetical protein
MTVFTDVKLIPALGSFSAPFGLQTQWRIRGHTKQPTTEKEHKNTYYFVYSQRVKAQDLVGIITLLQTKSVCCGAFGCRE